MAAEQWYSEEDEDSISGEIIGYQVRTLNGQDYFEVDEGEDADTDKSRQEAGAAADARVAELNRVAEVAAAAPLIAKAMRAQMVVNLLRGGFCSVEEARLSLLDLGWDGKADFPAAAWIDKITNLALKECQRLGIK